MYFPSYFTFSRSQSFGLLLLAVGSALVLLAVGYALLPAVAYALLGSFHHFSPARR